jgi:hypothetical protein
VNACASNETSEIGNNVTAMAFDTRPTIDAARRERAAFALKNDIIHLLLS